MAKSNLCWEHKGGFFAAAAGLAKECHHESFAGFHYCDECSLKHNACAVCGISTKTPNDGLPWDHFGPEFAP